jgi:hypothetical protein
VRLSGENEHASHQLLIYLPKRAKLMLDIGHCIEYVREHIMCQPDLSLVTFRWINNTAQHPDFPAQFYATNFDASEHTCAKWEPLDAWAGMRVFNLSNLDQLQRPGVDEETVVTEIRPIKGEPGHELLDSR